MELFLDRAGHVQPGFSVTAENALAVAQICYRLDGMPLAIEMAAASLRVLAVEQINARLHDRFRLLAGRSRNDVPRQHTLRATMEWSHDLLSPDERCLLARLGVFAGPLSLEAAEGVCAGDGIEPSGLLEVLTRLVDQSLVSVSVARGEARYRLLETVRAYAREKLGASGEERALRARHQQWYRAAAALAHRMFEEGAPEAGRLAVLERLEAEHADVLAALAWRDAEREDAEGRLRLGGALWRFWLFTGRRGEGRECLERVLAETPPGVSAARADALTAAGMLARAQGDYAGAAAHHETALAMRQALGDPREVALSLGNLAVVAHDRGEYERATALLEEALPLLAEPGSRFRRAIALNNLGRTARFRGDFARATNLTEEGLRLFRDMGHRYGIAAALHGLADLAQCEGDLERSATLYEESLALRRAVGHQPGIAISLNGLGALARRQGDLARASRLCDESLVLRRALGDRRGVAVSLGSLARIARDEGDLSRAGALCGESLDLHRGLANPVGMAAGLETMAAVAADRGEPIRAAWLLGAATALRETIGAPLSPSARQERDADAARARAACGDVAFASAWDQGRGAPLERAIAVARGRDAGIGPAGG
ncbi:MAG: tetratricopeptide repeat protein [Candidatus Rokubacteria bacterium]|nr:tetratricopeptide repeat protein [Candidatus Rokubacteria bacterium]